MMLRYGEFTDKNKGYYFGKELGSENNLIYERCKLVICCFMSQEIRYFTRINEKSFFQNQGCILSMHLNLVGIRMGKSLLARFSILGHNLYFTPANGAFSKL